MEVECYQLEDKSGEVEVAQENKNKRKSSGKNINGSSNKSSDSGSLSAHRIRALMKSQSSVHNITQDATFLMAKATERFITELSQLMAEEGLANSLASFDGKSGNSLTLTYDDLSETVHSHQRFDFLRSLFH